jgi:hypothetical protein
MAMATGDKVLVLLLAKLACCVGLGLAATGMLGALGVWLLDGAGRWLIGGALAALIAWIVLVRQGRPAPRRRAGLPGTSAGACPGLPCFDFRRYARDRWGLEVEEAIAAAAAARLRRRGLR